MRVREAFLYGEPAEPGLDAGALARFLGAALGAPARARGSLFARPPAWAAAELAAARVFAPQRPPRRRAPHPDDAALEAAGAPGGLVYYDGFELAGIAARLVPEADLGQGRLHVALTRRLACTYDEGDGRYHGRALIGANPAVVSTSGIREAPAKPRAYYIEMISGMAKGMDMAAMDARYAGSFVGPGDALMQAAACSYLLQAAAHYMTGEAFCPDRGCRLYNAHWQADMMGAARSGRLCGRHAALFPGLRGGGPTMT